jgi:HPr kinase/phosphorylase
MSQTLHATAVLVGADGVLIRGPSGSGKSTLTLKLIRDGGRLVADDQVMLSSCHGRLVATAPGATAGLVELRGRGLIPVPHEQSAVIRLFADIVEEEGLERMPEPHQLTATFLGIALPRQPIPADPERAIALIRAALGAAASQPDKGLANGGSFAMMAAPPIPTAFS